MNFLDGLGPSMGEMERGNEQKFCKGIPVTTIHLLNPVRRGRFDTVQPMEVSNNTVHIH